MKISYLEDVLIHTVSAYAAGYAAFPFLFIFIQKKSSFICFFIAGCEKMPMVRGEENGGRLVYMYEPRSTFVSTHDHEKQ